MFSEISEVNTHILLHCDDLTLVNACLTSKRLNELCDDYFWYQRLVLKGYSPLMYLKDAFYRDLYIKLVTQSTYMVFGDDNYLYNNINDAYQKFIDLLAKYIVNVTDMPPIERANEIQNFMANVRLPIYVQLYIFIDGVDVRIGDNRFVLLGINNCYQPIENVRFNINPNLSQMPILNGSNTYVYYEFDSSLAISKIGAKDNQTFSRLVDYSESQSLDDDVLKIITVNNNKRRSIVYRQNNLFISTDLPVIIIGKIGDNFLMAVLPPVVYKNLLFVARTDINGNQIHLVDSRSLVNVLPQIYPTLNWEPISSSANYPIDPNYLQTLQQ